jgi:uncharacterized protein (TIGR02757 family)
LEIKDLKEFLDEQTEHFNTRAFINDDPVQFPHRYRLLQDIEIAAFTVATIAWGKRPLILRSAERMLARMGDSPFDFVMNGDYAALGKSNVHRTFFEHDLAYMLRGFHLIFQKYGSVENMVPQCASENDEVGLPWRLSRLIVSEMKKANDGWADVRRGLTLFGSDSSALKRFNMALRWLVRNDGIVDLGVWKAMRPAELFIPLDVHVGRVARELELLKRRSNDRTAVEELTARLREFCPNDPVKYDFALFGTGVMR